MIISFLFPTVVQCLIWKELLEFLCFVSALNPGLQEWVSGSCIHALPHTKKIMFSCIVKGKLPVFCMSLQARSYSLAPLPFYMFLAD